MEPNWYSLLFYVGVTLLLGSPAFAARERVSRTPAKTLAERAGAAHFEERFEKIASSEESRDHRLRKRASDEDFDYEVYQGVVGRPGIDFPIHPRIPQTTFSCRTFGNGYFADLETECQVFHICDDGRKISFLCPNGTIFQQTELICDWWFKVNCPASPGHYAESAEMLSKAQARRNRPLFAKKKNEYFTNTETFPRKQYSDKNQYPLKKNNREFEGSAGRVTQGRRKGHRYESDEAPSLEVFDFEDVSGNAQKDRSGKELPNHPDSNDSEMQDVAESASFLGNRRNGVNYNSGVEAKRPFEEKKGLDRSKSDRGRQRYRGESGKSSGSEQINDRNHSNNNNNNNSNKNIENERAPYRERITTTLRTGFTSKSDGDSSTTTALIHEKKPNNSRDRSTFTTPRRFDNTRTTPYYTPTVPTIRGPNISAGTSSESEQILSTTSNVDLLSQPITQSNASEFVRKAAVQGFSTTSKGLSGVVSSTFAVSGPSGATIPPGHTNVPEPNHSHSKTSKGYGNTSKPLQTDLGLSALFGASSANEGTNSENGLDRDALYATSDKSQKQQFNRQSDKTPVNSEKDKGKGGGNDRFGIQKETELLSIPAIRQQDAKPGFGSLNDAQGNNFKGYSYKTPADRIEVKTTFGKGTHSPKEPLHTSSDSSSRSPNVATKSRVDVPSGREKDTFQGYSYSVGSDSVRNGKSSSSKGTGQETKSTPGQTSYTPSKSSDQQGQISQKAFQNGSTETKKKKPLDLSTATSTPLVIGTRRTISTEASHGTNASSPSYAVNILSNESFSSGKPSVSSSTNNVLNTIKYDSEVKATTFKPFGSSSGPTYLPKATTTGLPASTGSPYVLRDTTTIRPSSAGATYLPKPTKGSLPAQSVSEHVREMIKTLNELKEDLSNGKDVKFSSRAGLDIPPSSGPETLHSLALYFAGEGVNATGNTEKEEQTATIRADISAVPLSNKTIQTYEALFGLGSTEKMPQETISARFQPNVSRDSNDLEAQNSNNLLGNSDGKSDTRKIAQVFTNALSAYLEDPNQFRRTLAQIRPTEPLKTDDNEVTSLPRTTNAFFNRGSGASYLPTVGTTSIPPTTTEDLEVLDFSDVTLSTKRRSRTTTESPSTRYPGLNRIAASSLEAARSAKQGKKLHFNDDVFASTTESNQIAVEINKGLGLSTPSPYLSGVETKFGVDLSTTSVPDTTTNLNSLLSFELLPPVGSKSKEFGLPTSDILPPGIDDDEDTLQRAQSQSFASSRNRLGKDDEGKGAKMQGHYITKLMSDVSVTTENANPWFLDPLTINDGLMNEFRTTTPSPYTYLPKATSTSTETSPIHIDINGVFNRANSQISETERIGKALPGLPDDLLLPKNGMQKIANRVFGGLNETSAEHLMNVMQKADNNPTVRRLILLLIQTCEDDYTKTVEQSRQALLNALIGMDEKYALEDEIEIIKLRPKQHRRGKSIDISEQNLITTSTTEYPVTTFRRILDLSSYTTTTPAPSTTDTSFSTTSFSPEDTTRFEIRVEEPDESSSPATSTTETDSSLISTTTTKSSSSQETTSSYSTSDSVVSTTVAPIGSLPAQRSPRRRAKHLQNSLSQSTDFSHRSSDERALELLKSLYSIASKFGRR